MVLLINPPGSALPCPFSASLSFFFPLAEEEVLDIPDREQASWFRQVTNP